MDNIQRIVDNIIYFGCVPVKNIIGSDYTFLHPTSRTMFISSISGLVRMVRTDVTGNGRVEVINEGGNSRRQVPLATPEKRLQLILNKLREITG